MTKWRPPPTGGSALQSLADIERGIKELIIFRAMRQRPKLASSDLVPERAPAQLGGIQSHRVSINAAKPISGILVINAQ